MKALDLTGMRFGRLVAIERVEDKNDRVMWRCACDCGNEVVVSRSNLRYGKTKSCGCLARENMIGNNINETHGETHSRLYVIWTGMKQRVSNPNHINYDLYGGKGIKVCGEWGSFEPFRDWAMKNGYDDSLTLDRINGNGDYCPENCRWVDWETQQNNRCNNHLITFNDKTLTVSQWAREVGMHPKTLFRRINDKGWSVEKALTTPLMKHYRKKDVLA